MTDEEQAVELKPGWWVAITLKEDVAPLRCYVGQVQFVGKRGVRITLVDWLLGQALSWDLFVPWGQMGPVLIATEEHDSEAFGDAAMAWQTKCNELRGAVDD